MSQQTEYPTPSSPNELPIDHNILETLQQDLAELAPGLLEELATYFVVNTPHQLKEMHTAFTQEDGKALERLAHNLKSNSARLGALFFSTICLELEMLGQRKLFDEAHQKIAQLTIEYERVATALKEKLEISE